MAHWSSMICLLKIVIFIAAKLLSHPPPCKVQELCLLGLHEVPRAKAPADMFGAGAIGRINPFSNCLVSGVMTVCDVIVNQFRVYTILSCFICDQYIYSVVTVDSCFSYDMSCLWITSPTGKKWMIYAIDAAIQPWISSRAVWGDQWKNSTTLHRTQSLELLRFLPQDTIWLCQNSYWKWPCIVDFPIKNGDFP